MKSTQQDDRRRWWSGTSAHGWRLYFRLRNEMPEEIERAKEPQKRFYKVCDSIYRDMLADDCDVLRAYYALRRTADQVAHDYGIPEVIVYRIIRDAEKRVAVELGLLTD